MRANIYEFLATGFEEIEALTPVTVMRQGGQNFKLVSMTGSEYVETANGAWVKADMLFEASDFSDAFHLYHVILWFRFFQRAKRPNHPGSSSGFSKSFISHLRT